MAEKGCGRCGRRRGGFPVAALTLALCAVALVAGLALGPAASAEYPEATGFVNDYAGVLAPGERERLEAMLRDLERTTGAEVAVAVVAETAPETPKMYAVRLFQRWGVGKRGRDNGVLILVAMAERRVEVEVGYGLESVLPDAVVGRILDEAVVPALRRGDVAGGLAAAVVAIGERLRAAEGGKAGGRGGGEPPADAGGPPPGLRPVVLGLLVLGGLALVAWTLAAARRRRCPRCGGRLEAKREVLREPSSLVPGEGRLVLACPRCDYRREEIYSLPWFPPDLGGPGGTGWPGGAHLPGGRRWGGFGGGRGGWGGFRGFGGGRSGGGGAGRGW